jgi:hypothetical protein
MNTLPAGAQILKLEKITRLSGAITLLVGGAQANVAGPSCQAAMNKVHSRVNAPPLICCGRTSRVTPATGAKVPPPQLRMSSAHLLRVTTRSRHSLRAPH